MWTGNCFQESYPHGSNEVMLIKEAEMGYKMVFSDMDGTLLWKGVRLSDENIAAIRKAVDKGVDFVLCTGRGVFGVEKFLRDLDLMGKKGYVVCQNGATVYDLRDMKLVLKQGFSTEMIKPVADYARSLGVEMFYYDDRTFMVEKMTKTVYDYCEMMKAEPRVVTGPTDYEEGEITKCLFTAEPEVLEKVRLFAVDLLGENINIFFSSPVYMEFASPVVSKGSALEATAKLAGVDLKDTVAIGDGNNDIPMIRKAGLGVAMKNGIDQIKAEADYVTECTAEENGVAEVLEKFVL